MWKISKHITSGLVAAILVMLSAGVFAQPEGALRAYHLYKDGKLLEAREQIDEAVKGKKGADDHFSWLIRGFIYKDIYTQLDDKDPDSESRQKAIESLLTSMELDTKGEHSDNSYKALKYLATSYYNDAVLVMRELNMNTIDKAKDYYLRYKETMLKLQPDFDFDEKDVEFYKALATANRKIYEEDRPNRREYLDKALDYYDIVLQIDPDNMGANYNVAVNLYNEGAWRIDEMDPEAEIPDVVKVQAISIKNFEAALPYMKKAYELNPHREEILKGLWGIHLSLNDEEKATQFRRELEEKEDSSGEKQNGEEEDKDE